MTRRCRSSRGGTAASVPLTSREAYMRRWLVFNKRRRLQGEERVGAGVRSVMRMPVHRTGSRAGGSPVGEGD